MPEGLGPTPATSPRPARRFGFFGGVFTPSVLTILGVIMYLRLGWVVGSVGLGGALIIIGVSHLISLATGLSVASIATNRIVRAGGAYYMISRSIGAPVGAAVGIPLYLGQALSTTFYVVGFTEALNLLVPGLDPRLVGSGVLVVLTFLTMKSADMAIRIQYVIMAGIGLSLVSFFSGWSGGGVADVTWFHEGEASFAMVFAVFFPAVTGIMAGVSMSGDLKDPRKALPLGTLLAILVGFVVYAAIPIWMAMNADMETLESNPYAMWSMAAAPALIYVGVWGATLSSAVGSILGAPRTLQALAKDGLAPRLFARTSGPTDEPRVATLFTFALAEVGILVGSLDLIAPVLTMFFLATYGATNLACGLERWAATPSFRPSFKIPAWVSLAGAFGCFYVMSIINLPAMIAAVLFCLGLFVYAQGRTYGESFGDARHGLWAALVRVALLRLRDATYHPRNWRPNLVIFGGDPDKRTHLLELGTALVGGRGLVSYFYLRQGAILDLAKQRPALRADMESRLREAYPNVLPRVELTDDIYRGIVAAAQTYGIGGFQTNTVMLGWLSKPERRGNYVRTLRELVALDCSVLLVRRKPVRGLGRRARIDVWWGGIKGNGGLMLLLTYLLRNAAAWEGAKARVITIVQSADEADPVRTSLQELLDQARLEARAHVVERAGRSIAEVMQAESGDTDLALLGLKLPVGSEEDSPFFDRMDAFLEALPTTMMVCSAQHFEGEPVLFDE
ncbi:MAG: Na-K-Cl cotransporter [Pseudomonadota bacterium]